MSGTSYSDWILIDCSIMEVFRYVLDPRKLREWVPLYAKAHLPPNFEKKRLNKPFDIDIDLGFGKLLPLYSAFAPQPMQDTLEYIEIVPGRSVTLKATWLALSLTYTFEASSRGTIVRASYSPWGLGAYNPWVLLARPWLESNLRVMLVELRQRLECRRHLSNNRPVFFSYRRREDKFTGGRVCSALENEFGQDAIFRDIDSLRAGDYKANMHKALEKCAVVIAFIGPGWFDGLDEHVKNGTPDWVLTELEVALEMAEGDRKTGIVPVLVEGALDSVVKRSDEKDKPKSFANPLDALPSLKKLLPAPLQSLTDRQIHLLRPDPDFRHDMDRIVRTVWEAIRSGPEDQWLDLGE